MRPYRELIGSRIRSQTAYRRSFALDVSGSVMVGLVEFAEVYIIFANVDALGGLDFAGVALVFALAHLTFSVADLIIGHLDNLPTYLRMGTLDAFLLRPLPVLAQLVTSDVSLRRFGRIAVAAVQFWLVEGREFVNAFTYGGNYAASFPASVFAVPMRAFFTFVVPAAFVAYLPTLVLLDLPGPVGLPQWLGWCSPVAAVALWCAALAGWRAGLRHYSGAGS